MARKYTIDGDDGRHDLRRGAPVLGAEDIKAPKMKRLYEPGGWDDPETRGQYKDAISVNDYDKKNRAKNRAKSDESRQSRSKRKPSTRTGKTIKVEPKRDKGIAALLDSDVGLEEADALNSELAPGAPLASMMPPPINRDDVDLMRFDPAFPGQTHPNNPREAATTLLQQGGGTLAALNPGLMGILGGGALGGAANAVSAGEERDPWALGGNMMMGAGLGLGADVGLNYGVAPVVRGASKAIGKYNIPSAGLMDDWMPGIASEPAPTMSLPSGQAPQMPQGLPTGSAGMLPPPRTGAPQPNWRVASSQVVPEQGPSPLGPGAMPQQLGAGSPRSALGPGNIPQQLGPGAPSNVQRMSVADEPMDWVMDRMGGGVQMEPPPRVVPQAMDALDMDLSSHLQRARGGVQVDFGGNTPAPAPSPARTNTSVMPLGTPAKHTTFPSPEDIAFANEPTNTFVSPESTFIPGTTPGQNASSQLSPDEMMKQIQAQFNFPSGQPPPSLGQSRVPTIGEQAPQMAPPPSAMTPASQPPQGQMIDLMKNSSGVWNQQSDLDRLAWWLALMAGGAGAGAGAASYFGNQPAAEPQPPPPKAIQR